jgi:ubiquinone/menaquinone biosynthesis C-methylase UbiE
MKKFLVYWCSEGLESITDITQNISDSERVEKEKVWEILKSPELKAPDNEPLRMLNQLVQHMMMRARANSHRNYEIYTITTDDDVEREQLENLFKQNPQGSADLVRERGVKIYSDRNVDKVVIR